MKDSDKTKDKSFKKSRNINQKESLNLLAEFFNGEIIDLHREYIL